MKTRFFSNPSNDPSFVQRTCDNCGRTYFIKGVFAHMSRFCTDSCANHHRYERRKDNDGSNNTTTSTNNDMDYSEKAFQLQQDLNDIKLKYELLLHDSGSIADLKELVKKITLELNQVSVDFKTEKQLSQRLDMELKECQAQNERLAVAYIIASNPGKLELPLQVFSQNFPESKRWTAAAGIEFPVAKRWIVRKQPGATICKVISQQK